MKLPVQLLQDAPCRSPDVAMIVERNETGSNTIVNASQGILYMATMMYNGNDACRNTWCECFPGHPVSDDNDVRN
jgi:hypothetical protein